MSKYLISIVGATAIGKTALSIQLANHFNTAIISCDSRQFFKEMTIGTAVPSKEELSAAEHHFIQHISIFDSYNVGQFEKDAIEKLHELFQQHDIVIMVGGSGLYVDAVLKGLDEFPKVDPKIREDLNQQLETDGIESLQQQLLQLDPTYYERVALGNPHRLIRALEICIGSGKPYSSFLKDKTADRNFTAIKVGLTADRPIMYNRINQRVDIMMEEGLLEEAKALYPHKALNALQTVGYRELFEYLDGNYTLDFAISEIKKNTRRFAKRQGTWFRKDESTIWFDYQEHIETIVKEIESRLG
ncbi:tRNA (adenosine(37)-N6)-dimethylallyltransferase MiaA [Kordia sp. YSTF-M3]|uniref:tRNA dimethylallyltransferase n=1 Tax=Kordia aestuariivivens TaxID=2759037 RepID=A0ABR7QCD3_9FLAO|nr:tRNA (adenosine(37)-N6)-dimethylallyltransferase MiaA [Kordia aestuariivivens]MBC8756183.1 tRNA (adenosine(37)-N6)-dimethylallyltransferase MiaA [Kordia aestuariivivens]